MSLFRRGLRAEVSVLRGFVDAVKARLEPLELDLRLRERKAIVAACVHCFCKSGSAAYPVTDYYYWHKPPSAKQKLQDECAAGIYSEAVVAGCSSEIPYGDVIGDQCCKCKTMRPIKETKKK